MIGGAAAALIIGIVGWLAAGRWAYHRYVEQSPISFAPTGTTARLAATGITRSMAELVAQTPGLATNSCINLATFADTESQRWSSVPRGLLQTLTKTAKKFFLALFSNICITRQYKEIE